MTDDKGGEGVGRRGFIKSIFGLGSVVEVPAAIAKPSLSPAKFFWTDLHTGQIGFPGGQVVPAGLPGSLMKIVAAAALVDASLLRPEEKYECRGSFKLHNETVHCLYPHGQVDLKHALGLSCNIYFAQASKLISPGLFLKYASLFGLDKAVAIFKSGKFPQQPLSSSLNYVLGLDPELEPSALQIMRMAALVATKGRLPYLHSAEAPDANGAKYDLELPDLVWSILQQGMQIAAREGTGKKLDPDHAMKVALKTGTAPYGKTFQSWVTGYFPWDNPKYAFVLRATSGTSQDSAIPAARTNLFAQQWP
ncbi:MAG: hypothetical protein K2W82_08900 [Candidatus Obscuribacterales bacterium]|nr:hypothetical protein [Candidatus Obscuribacterales bacterium]